MKKKARKAKTKAEKPRKNIEAVEVNTSGNDDGYFQEYYSWSESLGRYIQIKPLCEGGYIPKYDMETGEVIAFIAYNESELTDVTDQNSRESHQE